MKGQPIDTDELQLDYAVIRLALEYLVYALKERKGVKRMLDNATKALQWAKTTDEYGDSCDDCSDQ